MGTIFTAKRPAPVSTYWEAGASAVDLLWQALYPIAQDRLTVGHFLSICGTSLAGTDDEGNLFVLVEPQARFDEKANIAWANEYRDAGVQVIDGACPLMFAEPVGWIHRLHRAQHARSCPASSCRV